MFLPTLPAAAAAAKYAPARFLGLITENAPINERMEERERERGINMKRILLMIDDDG